MRNKRNLIELVIVSQYSSIINSNALFEQHCTERGGGGGGEKGVPSSPMGLFKTELTARYFGSWAKMRSKLSTSYTIGIDNSPLLILSLHFAKKSPY